MDFTRSPHLPFDSPALYSRSLPSDLQVRSRRGPRCGRVALARKTRLREEPNDAAAFMVFG